MSKLSDSEAGNDAGGGEQKRRAFLLLLFLAGAGALFIHRMQLRLNELQGLSADDPDAALAEVQSLVSLLNYAGAAGMAAAALYLAYLCKLSIESGLFPPPHAIMNRGFRPLRGNAARRMAWFGFALAALFLTVALCLALGLSPLSRLAAV